jgi:DNA-binding beta-propeller fold protein YncE
VQIHCISKTSRQLSGLLLIVSTVAVASAQTYQAVGEYKLPGSSAKRLAIDTASRRLFVAGDDGIAVLNADNGSSLGMIPLQGAEDVLLIPAMNGDENVASTKGFATAKGKIVSFSLTDLKISDVGKLPTAGAASLCYDEDAKTVEVVSTGGSLVTVDFGSDKVIRSERITTGAGQISCGTLNHVYVADTEANVVHVLNHETGKNDGDLPMMTGHKPSGMTLDTKGRRLFVACEDGVIEIIDTDSGFTFIQLPGGTGPASETFAWTPQGKGQWKAAAFVAQQDGTLTGVRMNAFINYSVGGKYKLSPGLAGVAYDEQTHHLFLTAIHSGLPVVVVAGY